MNFNRVSYFEYYLELPIQLAKIHHVLHISLKKCVGDPSQIVLLERIANR